MSIKYYIPKSINAPGFSNPNNMIDGINGTNSQGMATTAGLNIALAFDSIDKSKVLSATLKIYGEAWDYGDGTNIRIKPSITNREIMLPQRSRMHSLDITDEFKSSFNNSLELKVYATNVMWETTAVIGEIYIELEVNEVIPPIVNGSVDFSDENKPSGEGGVGVNKLKLGLNTPIRMMIGGEEPKKIYMGEELVYSKGGVSVILDNPTITITKDKYKIRLEQNGYVEYFDCTTSPNTQSPGIVKSHTVQDEKGNTFYLALFNDGESAFRVDGLVPRNGGWTHGSPPLNSHSAIMYSGRANLNIGFTNIRNSIPRKVLEDGLRASNSAIRGLNYHIVERSMNTGELVNVPDNYYGVLYRSADHFDFKMNGRLMTNFGGEYTGTKANNGWIATFVHELCHSMAIPDNLTHRPTLYYGDINRDIILQSNDIKYVLDEYKRVYGIDLENLEGTNTFVTNIEIKADQEVDFIYLDYEDPATEADAIVTGGLELSHIETIESSETTKDKYYIYNIKNPKYEKGHLREDKIKVHFGININIDESKTYKLYLKTFDNCYSVLINDKQGIEEV